MKLIAATIATVILLFAPAAAHAGTSRATDPTPADLAAALTAAVAAKDLVVAFFASLGTPPAPTGVEIGGQALVVHELDPDFVTNRSQQATRFSFIAVGAKAPGGKVASLWMIRSTPGSWKLGNIAGGDQEQRYASQPGKVFREPQIGAWYAIRGDRVVPLNDEAKTSVGASGVTVAEYQRLVRERYADRLPGSDYDRSGQAGGYGLPAHRPAAETETGTNPITAQAVAGPPATPSGTGPLPWAVGAGVFLAALAAIRFLRTT
jgi:hypothetical protein